MNKKQELLQEIEIIKTEHIMRDTYTEANLIALMLMKN